jgi:ATP-dependent RNA helicase RhlE
MSFASLGLIEPIVRTLDALAYHTPTAVQEQAIPAILAGNDVMAAAQTGTGMTSRCRIGSGLSWAARSATTRRAR